MLKKGLIGLAALFAALPIFADTQQGDDYWMSMNNWYVGASGNFDWQTQLKSNSSFTAKNASGSTVAGTNAKVKFKSGWGATVAMGYSFEPWRVEFEGSFRKVKAKTPSLSSSNSLSSFGDIGGGNVKYYNVMVNGYYDFEWTDTVGFYLGVGAGWTHAKVNLFGAKKNNNALGYQAMAGLNWRFADDWALFAGYRFVGSTKLKADNRGTQVKLKSAFQNIAELGVRFYF